MTTGMRKMKACVIEVIKPRQMRPKCEGGADWSRASPILVIQKHTGLKLIWWPGGNYWSGIGGTSYHPTSLQLASFDGDFHKHPVSKEIMEGGRFSEARALGVKNQIDDFFNRDVPVHRLSLKYTLVIL